MLGVQTMTIPVYWFRGARGFYCHGILQAFFANRLWPLPEGLTFEHVMSLPTEPAPFGMVVLPGAWVHDKNLYAEVNEGLSNLRQCVVIHSGDEEVVMDSEGFRDQSCGNRLILMQAPRPGRRPDGRLLYGWPEDTRELLSTMPRKRPMERAPWSFCGQANHAFREDMVTELAKREAADHGILHITPGFAQGHPRRDYLINVSDAVVAPCPSGPQSPETFRLYEALEAGCIPIAQRRAPAGGWPEGFDYWTWRYGSVPFPTVEKWAEAHEWLDKFKDPAVAQDTMNRCLAWWLARKREEAYNLIDAIPEAVSIETEASQVSIVITSSPCPRTDTTEMIEDCIRRIRAYPELAKAEILLCLDGVRPELEHRRDAYREYVRRVVDKANWDPAWFGVLPIIFPEWTHQAGMVKEALKLVRTPLVLMVEHDTYPMGDIPWGGMMAGPFGLGPPPPRELLPLLEGSRPEKVNLIRLHIFEDILDEHLHLYAHYGLDFIADGVHLVGTSQWSQRPHLARTDWYRELLERYFPPGTKGFIEDTLVSPTEAGEVTGLFVYAPEGSMLRSGTVDGRGADPKAIWREE